MQSIGSRIKRERKAKGLRLKQMADELGVSTDYLYEIENGKINPDAEFLQNLKTRYNIDTDYIIHGKAPDIPGTAGQISFEDIVSTEGIDTVEKLVTLMNLSLYVKNSVLSLATKFVLENREIIKGMVDRKLDKERV